MLPRRHHAAAALCLAIIALFIVSHRRQANFILDGKRQPTLGAGGIAVAHGSRNAAGNILFEFSRGQIPVNYAFTSVGGFRAGGSMIPEIRGVASLRTSEHSWLPWTAGGRAISIIYIPLWPTLLLAMPLAVYSIRRWRRIPAGHCPHCRYDLRALPPHSPCPECGRTRDSR